MKLSLGITFIALFSVAALVVWAGADQATDQQGNWGPSSSSQAGSQPLWRSQPSDARPQSPDARPQAPEQGQMPMDMGPGMQGMRGMQGMHADGDKCGCDMCKVSHRGAMGMKMEQRMRDAGVPEEQIQEGKMLMGTRIHPADPQALMSMKDQLQLTDAQVGNLERIIDSAQERALGILTPEQWQQVRQMRPQAVSMMELHQSVMPQMMRAMREHRMQPPDQGMQQQQTPPYGRPQAGQQAPGCKPGTDCGPEE